MVAMLVDHVAQHAAGLFFVLFSTQAAAAPGGLFPDQQAQLIAEIEHKPRLLIVGQA
jgi:hypothetical protein